MMKYIKRCFVYNNNFAGTAGGLKFVFDFHSCPFLGILHRKKKTNRKQQNIKSKSFYQDLDESYNYE